MKHRILITNYQKGRKYGQPIPIRPALRIINNYDSRSAITIPVLPKVRPLFSFFIMLGIAIIISTREDATQKRAEFSG